MTAKRATGIAMVFLGFGSIFAAVAFAHGIVPAALAFAVALVLAALIVGGINLSV